MRALITGRFQPFHRGHLALTKQILGECDELVIAITSAQFNYIDKDPFTAGERMLMIHGALKEARVDMRRCYVTAVINDENNARWIAHLKSLLPHFDVVYTGNEYVATLMRDAGVKVRGVKFHDRKKYNGTAIRKLMLEGKWQQLLPGAVVRVINSIDGIKRMQVIARSESKPQEW